MSANAEASSSKHKERKHKSKDKGSKKDKSLKLKHKSKPLAKAEHGLDGPFELRTQRMRLSVPPKFSTNWLEGVREKLDSMLMRFVPQMGGVLLAHWDHQIGDDTVKIINECPFGVCEVTFASIIWAPRVGQKLYGTHSLSSPSHLSLLFAKTFNVSIPLQHIPQEQYEFEHSEAQEEEEDQSSDEEGEGDLLNGAVHEVGRWKEKGTGKVVGSAGERVGFTVIGLQVTNQMLSLTGSLLADPSKPQAIRAASARVQSLSPDLPDPEPAAKVARTQKKPRESVQATATVDTPAIDESKLTARELKQLRKDQAKAKRDARKARKEDEEPASLKRKADEDELEGERKKRKA